MNKVKKHKGNLPYWRNWVRLDDVGHWFVCVYPGEEWITIKVGHIGWKVGPANFQWGWNIREQRLGGYRCKENFETLGPQITDKVMEEVQTWLETR